jgi:hypothetical protein
MGLADGELRISPSEQTLLDYPERVEIGRLALGCDRLFESIALQRDAVIKAARRGEVSGDLILMLWGRQEETFAGLGGRLLVHMIEEDLGMPHGSSARHGGL